MPGVSKQPVGWIEQSDLFILSSRFEGWGLVLGEAMAAGLPVISFDCEWGPAEMIEQETSGILVPNGDVEARAEALARLCSDGALRIRLGETARAAMRRFTPDRILEPSQQRSCPALANVPADRPTTCHHPRPTHRFPNRAHRPN